MGELHLDTIILREKYRNLHPTKLWFSLKESDKYIHSWINSKELGGIYDTILESFIISRVINRLTKENKKILYSTLNQLVEYIKSEDLWGMVGEFDMDKEYFKREFIDKLYHNLD